MRKEHSLIHHKLNRSELPSIYKNKRQSQVVSMREGVTTSILDEKQYNLMTVSELKIEKKKLKAQIMQINKKTNFILEKESIWRIKPLEKRNLTKQEQYLIVLKEEQNNRKILNLYSHQLQQLDQRKQKIKEGTKNNTISTIMQTEQKILNIKLLLRELKKKQITKQKKIAEGAEDKKLKKNVNYLKQLQKEYINYCSKFDQMKLKLEQTEVKAQRLKIQNQSLFEQYKRAEQIIVQFNLKDQDELKYDKIHNQYIGKLSQVEATRKRLVNTKEIGEKRYLLKLKQLDTLNNLNSHFNSKQINKKLQHNRQMIQGLQEILYEQQIEILQKSKQKVLELNKLKNTQNTQQHQNIHKLTTMLKEYQQTPRQYVFIDKPKQEQTQDKQQQQLSDNDKQLFIEAEKQANMNSMFLTMPQQSQNDTLYKKGMTKNSNNKHIQSNRTVSLRYVQQQQKTKLIQREITSTVSQANEAVQSIQNLFDKITKKQNQQKQDLQVEENK